MFTLLRGTPALWDAPLAIPSGSFFARYEMRDTIFEIRFTLHEIRHTQYAIRNTIYDIRITQYGSIKIERLCETNPISEIPKMIVTVVYIMTNNKKPRTMSCQKQTQTKPNFGLFNFSVFPYNRAIDNR